jgi:hypothetical protein
LKPLGLTFLVGYVFKAVTLPYILLIRRPEHSNKIPEVGAALVYSGSIDVSTTNERS